jgi:thymidylate synthase
MINPLLLSVVIIDIIAATALVIYLILGCICMFDKKIYEENEGNVHVIDIGTDEEIIHPEMQYINLVKHIIDNGDVQPTRTGVDCHVVLGHQMRFNLREGFPLFTTKRVFWRGVVEELLWFMRGDTDAKILDKKGVKIWNGNSSRQQLDKIAAGHAYNGDTYLETYFKVMEEGDCGPIYGFNWRHFGARYITCNTNYEGQGFDQLKDIVERLRTSPMSRDIILTSYDPINAKKGVLYPCISVLR